MSEIIAFGVLDEDDVFAEHIDWMLCELSSLLLHEDTISQVGKVDAWFSILSNLFDCKLGTDVEISFERICLFDEFVEEYNSCICFFECFWGIDCEGFSENCCEINCGGFLDVNTAAVLLSALIAFGELDEGDVFSEHNVIDLDL